MQKMSNTDRSWRYWGEKDPYFGVLTSEKFRTENLTNETKQEFFLSGDEHIKSILGSIHKYIDPKFSPQKAIDFGCGTGRLLIPLAKICKEVVGIDISDKMLIEANKNCELESLRNVSFIISDDDLSGLNGEHDLIHSYIVFQHIPVQRGEKIIKKLLAHLSTSGIGVFHVTYFRETTILRKTINWLRRRVPFMHNLIYLAQGKKMSEPMMQMNDYSLSNLYSIFQQNGIEKIHSEFTFQEGHYGVILYVIKRNE
jgi:ubiquinone/menaquinone biosynthesis C-methylase UbiE